MRLLLVLVLLGACCDSGWAEEPCSQAHRIESLLVMDQGAHLIEFDRFLVHASAEGHILHRKDKPGPFELCGMLQVPCKQSPSPCQVCVLFDRVDNKFQFANVKGPQEVLDIVLKGSRSQFGFEAQHQMVAKLSDKLNKLERKQKMPLAFEPTTSTIYIADNAARRIYRWPAQENSLGELANLSALANRVSALFLVSGQKPVHALLGGLNSVFALQGDLFEPTDQDVKMLIGCELVSPLKTRSVLSSLALFCLATQLALVVTLCIMFFTMERIFSEEFDFTPKQDQMSTFKGN